MMNSKNFSFKNSENKEVNIENPLTEDMEKNQGTNEELPEYNAFGTPLNEL